MRPPTYRAIGGGIKLSKQHQSEIFLGEETDHISNQKNPVVAGDEDNDDNTPGCQFLPTTANGQAVE